MDSKAVGVTSRTASSVVIPCSSKVSPARCRLTAFRNSSRVVILEASTLMYFIIGKMRGTPPVQGASSGRSAPRLYPDTHYLVPIALSKKYANRPPKLSCFIFIHGLSLINFIALPLPCPQILRNCIALLCCDSKLRRRRNEQLPNQQEKQEHYKLKYIGN